jgi:hypothetical protein
MSNIKSEFHSILIQLYDIDVYVNEINKKIVSAKKDEKTGFITEENISVIFDDVSKIRDELIKIFNEIKKFDFETEGASFKHHYLSLLNIIKLKISGFKSGFDRIKDLKETTNTDDLNIDKLDEIIKVCLSIDSSIIDIAYKIHGKKNPLLPFDARRQSGLYYRGDADEKHEKGGKRIKKINKKTTRKRIRKTTRKRIRKTAKKRKIMY